MNFTVKDVSKCFLKSSELMNFVTCTAFGPILYQLLVEKIKPLTMCLRKHCSNNKEKSSICFHFVSIVSMEITREIVIIYWLVKLVFVTDHFDGQTNSVKILPFHLASHISLYLENVAITDLLNYPACLNGLLDICAKQGEFVSNHLIFLWFSYYDRSV